MSKANLPIKKHRQIAKAKLSGHSNKAIGAIQYPNAKPLSQSQQVSKVLKKPNVVQYLEQTKLLALKEHNITWSRIIRPISEALEAQKMNQFTGEITVDHTTRLSASKQARELLQVKEIDNESKEQLLNLPNVDEIQLVRLLKNKE